MSGRERRSDALMPNQDRPLILETTIKIIYHSILVLALYFLFAGHNHPGGGFVGGLMVGSAISLRYLAGGVQAVQSTFVLRPHLILGIGLVISSLTALMPVVLGNSVLQHGKLDLHWPLVGEFHLTTTLTFDIGVFLIVTGLVLMAFEAFGADFDEVVSTGTATDSHPKPDPSAAAASTSEDGEYR
jgi:multisubunit Na+/H+ antiporter MnhB subunit